MGKPLLTDEIIRRANQKGQDAMWEDPEATKEIRFAQRERVQLQVGRDLEETMPIHVERSVIKSRRIENEKRGFFQNKLNQILFILVLLVIALILAVIYL